MKKAKYFYAAATYLLGSCVALANESIPIRCNTEFLYPCSEECIFKRENERWTIDAGRTILTFHIGEEVMNYDIDPIASMNIGGRWILQFKAHDRDGDVISGIIDQSTGESTFAGKFAREKEQPLWSGTCRRTPDNQPYIECNSKTGNKCF